MNKLDFMHSTSFKLLRTTKGTSVNDCDFFELIIYVKGRPLRLVAPNFRKPLHAIGHHHHITGLLISTVGANFDPGVDFKSYVGRAP